MYMIMEGDKGTGVSVSVGTMDTESHAKLVVAALNETGIPHFYVKHP